MIKIGDKIRYRGCFGMDKPKNAVIVGLTLTSTARSKYGDDVTEVTVDDVAKNRVLFSLNDGHWCYSEQITEPDCNYVRGSCYQYDSPSDADPGL